MACGCGNVDCTGNMGTNYYLTKDYNIMANNTYNGWTNRATWLVNIWFNPECKDDVYMARDTLESAIDDLPDFLKDFIDADVNWDELLEHFTDDEEKEEE